jgi:myosin-1
VEILEELRREHLDSLATLIQKTYRGYAIRQKWHKLKGSQIAVTNCWKKWKDKSNIEELRQRKKEEWAAGIIQKHIRSSQVNYTIMIKSITRLSDY